MEETEGTESPTVERQYAYGPGIDDVVVLFDKNGESYDAYYYLKDPLWTVEALVDENAAIVEAYSYEVYGQPTIKTGDGGDGDWFDGDETTASASAKGNPYLFTARRWDDDISLQYSRARWYAPVPGRWLSRDPLEYLDGPNLYRYARNKPAFLTDAYGRSSDYGVLDIVHWSGPHAFECGKATFSTMWLIRGPKVNGWVVQRVHYRSFVVGCGLLPTFIADSSTFWELWPVIDGVVYSGKKAYEQGYKPTASGRDDFATEDEGFCTWGWQRIDGEAKFFAADDIDPIKKPPPGWTYQKVPAGAWGYTTTTMPSWWPGVGYAVTDHHLEVEWDCCWGEFPTEVISSAPAPR